MPLTKNGKLFKFQKCFGVGVGKTGTTSLTEALEILGYKNSVHFPLKQMDLLYEGYFDAATDTPVALNFEKILNKFPDAGYILTTREIESWLDSIETHMTVGRGRFGQRVSEIREIREKLYGNIMFDREVYKQSFKNHIQKVMDIFSREGKLNNLLIISLVDNPSWDILCEFLELPVPEVDFPHKNKGKYERISLAANS